jgi:beta-glucanase (GH16 family)
LIWSDEFNSYKLNETNWIAINGSVNGESQYYTADNAFVNESYLVVEARKEKINLYNYTSAKLMSRISFKYGIFEARIKLPKGSICYSIFS